MAKMSFDPIDAALTVTALMAAFIVTGIASFDLFNVAFSDTLFTVGGYDLSTAWILAAGSLAATVATNDNAELGELHDDLQDLDQYYYGAAIASVGLLLAWPVFPSVADFFMSEDLWGLVYVGAVTTGQFVLGWML